MRDGLSAAFGWATDPRPPVGGRRKPSCGREITPAGAGRWTEWALRLSLATAFLSAVGDRFGAWGPQGSPHVSWGDWRQFLIYADRLNWYMPTAVQPAAAVLATAAEVIFAMAMITGFRLRETALGSGVLLIIFGISMTITLGIKAPLDYSVFTAAAAAFSLALMTDDRKRQVREAGTHEPLGHSGGAPAACVDER